MKLSWKLSLSSISIVFLLNILGQTFSFRWVVWLRIWFETMLYNRTSSGFRSRLSKLNKWTVTQVVWGHIHTNKASNRHNRAVHVWSLILHFQKQITTLKIIHWLVIQIFLNVWSESLIYLTMKCNDNEQWNKPNVEKVIPKYTEENFGRKFRMNTRAFANLLLIFFLRKTNIALQKNSD